MLDSSVFCWWKWGQFKYSAVMLSCYIKCATGHSIPAYFLIEADIASWWTLIQLHSKILLKYVTCLLSSSLSGNLKHICWWWWNTKYTAYRMESSLVISFSSIHISIIENKSYGSVIWNVFMKLLIAEF